ncbi:MAG: DUF4176 domain-containing protein [Eubacterium sp.]|nr:DUF4176 domain-containing protein [Eubacterium sp.]
MSEEAGVVERYLPLGSIVVVNGNVKKLMITARGIVSGQGEGRKLFDYGAALYPEGVLDDKMIFFNHKDIYRIVFEGYTDADDDIMNDNIKKWVKSVKEREKNGNES